MSLYRGQISQFEGNTYSTVINAGSHSLKCEFSWDEVAQEQYDEYLQAIDKDRLADPLVDNGLFISDYDWLQYYLNLQNVDIEEYLLTNPPLPQSIYSIPSLNLQRQILEKRIIDAIQISDILSIYEDSLEWHIKVTDEFGEVTTGVVQPGGWYRQQNDFFSFRFISPVDKIKKEDLPYASIEVETYDE